MNKYIGMRRGTMPLVIAASFIGTTMEWYDFFLYGTAAALVLNKLYFPTISSTAGTMAAFATYAVGFCARPVGGIFFGHWGDRVGRKPVLITTMLMMGLCTFAIGLLPTYSQIGVAAPALLVLLRFIQGLGVGGEWGGAVIMASEHAREGRRGFYASWPQMGVPMGLLLATVVFGACTHMPSEQFMAWGWRIPFLFGMGLVVIGLFVRLNVEESPLFTHLHSVQSTSTSPMLDVLRRPREVLLGAGSRFSENAWFYLFTVFVLSYGTHQLGYSEALLLNVMLGACVIELVTLPLFGALSDVIGRRPVYIFGTACTAIFAFPAFWLLGQRTTWGAVLAIVPALGIAHAAMYGPEAAFFCELFGTRTRCSGASLGYQIGSVFSGGFSPLIATALLTWSGGRPWPVAVYLVGMAAISILSIALASETAHQDMPHEEELSAVA